MNREIKFRVWKPQYKHMDFLQKVEYFGGHGIYDQFEGCNDNDAVWMQFTGLRDKNGVEIYEGDIISYWNGTVEPDENGDLEFDSVPGKKFKRSANKVKEVVFENASFRVKNSNPLLSQHLGGYEIEVIGNIYQNPELLETNKQ